MAANLKDIPRRFYTLDEYFALERTGDARYEYWQGDIVCMSGGSERHGRIGGNVYFTLRQQLVGSNCEAFTGDLPIKTPRLSVIAFVDGVPADRARRAACDTLPAPGRHLGSIGVCRP